MECHFMKEDLLQGLQFAQSIADRRNTMPILANILLKTRRDSVEISATDLEISVQTQIPAKIREEGTLSLQAKKIYEIVRELNEDEILLRGKENFWGELEAGKSFFSLMGLDPRTFPKLEQEKKEVLFQIDSSSLRDFIERTTYSTSTDETRYHLNGVLLELENGKDQNFVKGIATDGHRLAMVQEEIQSEGPLRMDKGVLLPRKGLMEVKRAFTESAGNVEVGISKKMVSLNRDGLSLLMRLIEGEFPDYRQVIPKSNPYRLVVEKDSLIAALRRISLFTSERYRGVRLNIGKKELTLSLNNPDVGEVREVVSSSYSGDPMEIGFNTRYLLDAVVACREDSVLFLLKDELGPVLIQGENDRGALAVIMPMRF